MAKKTKSSPAKSDWRAKEATRKTEKFGGDLAESDMQIMEDLAERIGGTRTAAFRMILREWNAWRQSRPSPVNGDFPVPDFDAEPPSFDPPGGRTRRFATHLKPHDVEILSRLEDAVGGNRTSAIRQILREWESWRRGLPSPANGAFPWLTPIDKMGHRMEEIIAAYRGHWEEKTGQKVDSDDPP